MMRWIDLDGAALRYHDTGGDGPVLLLLHEMGGSLESWDFMLPLLAPRCRVLRYDQRGAGLSEKPRTPLTMPAQGNDAVALLDALGITQPVVTVGMAVGGALALHIAAAHPGRVRGVVVSSPATGVNEAARVALLARAQEMETKGARAVVDTGLQTSYPPAMRGDAERFAHCRASRLGVDPAGQAATARMLADLDMTADLASIACPVLVLAAKHDLTRPPERVRPVAEAIAGAELREVESGHFMAIQTPELMADAVLGFLDRL
ncbi:alpha/beta fold hydrolase [Falsiroseomonas ponticola]|uniref:alpha/beta fold hydrolase n=1 Tax=Falsiroseomonas ponticola TaxID=2786951 RepID=UPI0019326795|nr:alpha/beta hydrolase [Roseomonas ponticola]